MLEYVNSRPVRLASANREVLTHGDLPPAGITRWVASRKAQVVAAVRSGLLTLEEALARYDLSVAEFYSWQAALDRNGVDGLRVGAVQRERPVRRSRIVFDS